MMHFELPSCSRINTISMKQCKNVQVLKVVDNAPPYKKKKDVAADFNIPTNTLSTVLKNNAKVQAYEQQTVDASHQHFRSAL
ncbi:UNVERIFIED_CONTAM: hypothetical protein FKN15_068676 [Acipenser sinensis]